MIERAIDPLAVCIDAIHGVDKPRATALIDEAACIGCTLCIHACPVDAIVGAAKQMHTVVAAWCTGCELCLPPCPVDCIGMLPLPEPIEDPETAADMARRRRQLHLLRRARERRGKADSLAAKLESRHAQGFEKFPRVPDAKDAASSSRTAEAETRQALIAAAIDRARQLNAR